MLVDPKRTPPQDAHLLRTHHARIHPPSTLLLPAALLPRSIRMYGVLSVFADDSAVRRRANQDLNRRMLTAEHAFTFQLCALLLAAGA